MRTTPSPRRSPIARLVPIACLVPVACLVPIACLVATGCAERDDSPAGEPASPGITNRIELPPEVIGNLGITFETVGRGRLERTLEVPGRLELPDDRQWSVRAPAPGRVRIQTERWAHVDSGDALAELISPDLLEVQRGMFAAREEEQTAEASIAAHLAENEPAAARAAQLETAAAAARERLREAEGLLGRAAVIEHASSSRVDELERFAADDALSTRELLEARRAHVDSEQAVWNAAARRDELRTKIADLDLEAARARASVETRAVRLGVLRQRTVAARLAFSQRLQDLAALTGIPADRLVADGATGPNWQSLEAVPIHAPGSGQVVELWLSDGEWAERAAPLLRIVDPSVLVFRGRLPESDLERIPADAGVLVLPAAAGVPPIETHLRGPLPVTDEVSRTIRLEAPVPNPDLRLPSGLSAVARVRLGEKTGEEVLIPEDCVTRDGLEQVVFRRDPEQRDIVVRLPVELGDRAGGRVEVLSGLLDGDEIVRNGIHQLKYAGLGQSPAGGHFHADGSFHGEDH